MKKTPDSKSKLDLTSRTMKDLTVRTSVKAGCTCCSCGASKACSEVCKIDTHLP